MCSAGMGQLASRFLYTLNELTETAWSLEFCLIFCFFICPEPHEARGGRAKCSSGVGNQSNAVVIAEGAPVSCIRVHMSFRSALDQAALGAAVK